MSCCPIHVSLLDSLDTTYGIAALWIGLALLASVISIRIGLSVALVEILVGVVGGNLLGMTPTEWITFLAGVGSVLLTFSIYRPLLDWAAWLLGVSYPPSLLFGLAFLFLLVIVLHYSLVISSHRDSIRRLAQTIALLERRLEDRAGK